MFIQYQTVNVAARYLGEAAPPRTGLFVRRETTVKGDFLVIDIAGKLIKIRPVNVTAAS